MLGSYFTMVKQNHFQTEVGGTVWIPNGGFGGGGAHGCARFWQWGIRRLWRFAVMAVVGVV